MRAYPGILVFGGGWEMSTWIAFWKKEWMELIRGGKFIIFLLISALFGLMNPAIAKLTPWLMESMADSLQDTGLYLI